MALYAPVLNHIWNYLADQGHDPERLFHEAGIAPGLRQDASARVDALSVDRLLHMAEMKTCDDALVLQIVGHFHPSYWGAIGYAWLTSESLRSAFQRVQRYSRMVADELVIELRDRTNELQVILGWRTEKGFDPSFREILRLANVVMLCRFNFGAHFKAVRIHLQRTQPSRPAPYEAFFNCALLFESDETMLVLDKAIADSPLASFDAALGILLDQQIADYLARIDKQDILSQAKSVIFQQLPSGYVSVEDVAVKLHLSARTLRRKLQMENTSFKSLLAETRQELGERYIRDNNLSLTEISYLLGFSESSSFSRAFKNWTGVSPLKRRNTISLSDNAS
jgi:AraC-like DNA-binding protein